MAKVLAGLLFEEAVQRTLQEIGAVGQDHAVRTSRLAKSMRRLGLPFTRDQIIVKLHNSATDRRMASLAFYVGGTNNELDTFAWAIPNGAI